MLPEFGPSATLYELERAHHALVHINMVKDKLKSGEYPLELASC